MDTFKIELFKKENPLLDFPQIIALDQNDMLCVRQNISQKLNININLTGKELLNLIVKSCRSVPNYNACTIGFLLSDVLKNLEIVPKNKVYINWYQFDKIDILSFNDIDKYFDYIWFPSSDDIEIFDDTYDWMLSIRHDGHICCNRLNQK
jgi:hypothetical protein